MVKRFKDDNHDSCISKLLFSRNTISVAFAATLARNGSARSPSSQLGGEIPVSDAIHLLPASHGVSLFLSLISSGKTDQHQQLHSYLTFRLHYCLSQPVQWTGPAIRENVPPWSDRQLTKKLPRLPDNFTLPDLTDSPLTSSIPENNSSYVQIHHR